MYRKLNLGIILLIVNFLVIGSFAFLSSHLVLVFRSLAVFALFILLCYCVFVNLKKLSIDK